jgi:hypothetical protein
MFRLPNPFSVEDSFMELKVDQFLKLATSAASNVIGSGQEITFANINSQLF